MIKVPVEYPLFAPGQANIEAKCQHPTIWCRVDADLLQNSKPTSMFMKHLSLVSKLDGRSGTGMGRRMAIIVINRGIERRRQCQHGHQEAQGQRVGAWDAASHHTGLATRDVIVDKKTATVCVISATQSTPGCWLAATLESRMEHQGCGRELHFRGGS